MFKRSMAMVLTLVFCFQGMSNPFLFVQLCRIAPEMVERATEEDNLEQALYWSEVYHQCNEHLEY